MTANNENGYPLYRRRDDGRTHQKEIKGKTFTFDNRWVVPYNPHLLLLTRAHTNVEICSTVMAYKYLYKYVYKGPDMAVVTVKANGDQDKQDVNELQRYVEGRYISASEAFWRFFGYIMHEEWPNVVPLSVHLPNQQVRFLSSAQLYPLCVDYIFRQQRRLEQARERRTACHNADCMVRRERKKSRSSRRHSSKSSTLCRLPALFYVESRHKNMERARGRLRNWPHAQRSPWRSQPFLFAIATEPCARRHVVRRHAHNHARRRPENHL